MVNVSPRRLLHMRIPPWRGKSFFSAGAPIMSVRCVTLYAGHSLEASVVGSQLGTMDESTYNELFDYVSVGKYSEGATIKESKTTDKRKVYTSFFVKEDALFHKGWKGREQRVVKADELQSLLQQMHASVVGGAHFGD